MIAGIYARLDWILLTICCVCMVGSGTGFVLWLKGHRRIACFLGASGLLSAGAVAHILLGTVGSAAGILYLASVITAGVWRDEEQPFWTSLHASQALE